jgi:hypothetical protein
MYRGQLKDTDIIYVSLDEIKGAHDHLDMKDLILKGNYNWSLILSDIHNYGLQENIIIQSEEPHDKGYIVVDGNHRLRVLKYLYPKNNVMRFKLKKYNDETNR